ncbi:hypothetical protein ATCV1_z310R [Acanthocystis turfacea chlorella virus 1]|uniref:Uncharacterized protein z310R n=1 Tax=Chlorovirus heliozoae TaxID=322019 RepID=A7K8S0_9PHYC|nr:hypothetical protein ATCV1_z310R [Acanthocystis turfacea chlorella virus 1]ABT16444.1 hypothetical protein ATCV1_z310R [Acanthocystis turfacea chlorella virus 1]
MVGAARRACILHGIRTKASDINLFALELVPTPLVYGNDFGTRTELGPIRSCAVPVVFSRVVRVERQFAREALATAAALAASVCTRSLCGLAL